MSREIDRLKRPDGVRDLLPGLAVPQRETESLLRGVFEQWGYFEVITPTFELNTVFVGGLKLELEDQLYRFFDLRGRTLVLRPDWTLPLVRVAVSQLHNEPRPLRLSYFGNVFRQTSPLLGKKREFAQAGVELIGVSSPQGDGEIVSLAAAALQKIGLPDVRFCLGHAGLLEALLDHRFSAEQAARIKLFFNNKDFVSLRQYLDGLGLDEYTRAHLLALPELKGDVRVLKRARSLLSPAAREAVDQLQEIVGEVELYGASPLISIDLGLVRGLDYYTGMIFEAFSPHLGVPLCGGGRYDQLLEKFGRPEPAVGFALSLDSVLIVLGRLGLLRLPHPDTLVCYTAGKRRAALQQCATLRAQGQKVVLDTAGRSLAEARARALTIKASSLVYVADGCHMEKITPATVKGKEVGDVGQ